MLTQRKNEIVSFFKRNEKTVEKKKTRGMLTCNNRRDKHSVALSAVEIIHRDIKQK